MKPVAAKALFIPTFVWNYALARIFRRRRWWDRVDPCVILGALPLKRDVAELSNLGVRGVINMCREYRGPIPEYQKFRIEQLWLPTIDFNPPSLEDVERGVGFIQKFAEKNQSVYVHCKAGRARSATVVICWLYKYRGMDILKAQQHLLQCRPHVHAKLANREVVKAFVAANPS